MTVLIITEAQDLQAALVAKCITLLESPVQIFCQSTALGSGELHVDLRGSEMFLTLGGFSGSVSSIGSFWNRRDPRFLAQPKRIDPADYYQCSDCTLKFLDAIRVQLDDTFAVNPSAAPSLMTNKLRQLRVASAVGFSTPETIMSSAPTEIERFRRDGRSVCVKPFGQYYWKSANGLTKSTTHLIAPDEVIEAGALSAAPLIYQSFIEKRRELRLVCFGNYVAGTQLQFAGDVDPIDWRRSPHFALELEPAVVEERLKASVIKLRKALGLRFGIFEFVESYDGEIFFLEVNEAGEFTWQEQFCQDVSLVEPFARFLIGGSEEFDWNEPPSEDLRMQTLLSGGFVGAPAILMTSALPAVDPPHRPAEE